MSALDDILNSSQPVPLTIWNAVWNYLKALEAETLTFIDSTLGNASTTKHGFMPKGDGNANHYYCSDGTQKIPQGGAGWSGTTGMTDNAILLADGVGSDTIKGSGITIETALTDDDSKIPTSGATCAALAALAAAKLSGTGAANGKIYIGKADGTFALVNITPGANITITNADGVITIASSGGGDFLVGQIFS